MKIKIQAFFTLLLLLVSAQANAISHSQANVLASANQTIIKTHDAIRSVSLRIRMDDDLHGIIESKTCSFCQTIKITITPETKAYANNINVPLKQAKNRIGRFATVIYELKTKNVSAIRW